MSPTPTGGPPAARAQLEAIFRAALRAADPARALDAVVAGPDVAGRVALAGMPFAPSARFVVLAAGKAACAMAAALEARLGERIERGLAVTKDGHRAPLRRFAVREAAHPVPDERSAAAGREALDLAASCAPDDVFVLLLSGGASALLSCPPPGLSQDDLARTNAALLACGAPIAELNAVRKHLSVVSGGRLAVACGAGRIVVLAVSDVLGDPWDVIGSGPCAPDPSTFADALQVVSRRRLEKRLPAAALAHLAAGAEGRLPETPKPGDPALARVHARIVASNADALAGACAAARAEGLHPVVAARELTGEAREAGRRVAALAGAVRAPGPLLLVVGGETTVTVRGRGRGGRSQSLALAAALALSGRTDAALLAAGTDGTDGPTDAAGAFADGGTVARGAAAGRSAAADLDDDDAYAFFAAEGGLLRTGPTRTNVMDLVLLRLGAGR